MAYVTLLSIIPSLAAVFALISLFSPLMGGDNMLMTKAKDFILGNLAAGSGEQAVQYLDNFLRNLDMTKIGLTGVAGLMVSLVLLLRQIELALNKIWLVSKERNLVTRFVYFWTFLTLGTFLLVLVFGFLAGSQIQSIIKMGEISHVQRGFFSIVTPWVATGIFFFLLYKVVPNCYVTAKQAMFGTIPAILMFNIASSLYTKFAAKFTSYQAVYGALAAVPLFLTWLYILWLIILTGALLSWRSQQGFHVSDDDEKSTELKPSEKHRNHQLQGVVPYLVTLVSLHQHGLGSGKGITGVAIAELLNLPPHWIREASEFLIERGFIVLAQENDQEKYGDIMASRIYPAYPPEALKHEQLLEGLTSDAKQWLHSWKHALPLDLQHTVEDTWFALGEKPGSKKTNLAEVLGKLQQLPTT